MNSQGQCDLIDMQSEADSDYKFILTYQDQLTKFCFLKPLKRKTWHILISPKIVPRKDEAKYKPNPDRVAVIWYKF